ncbi:MAG: TA system VapC family ribonuclease toxin [Vicinamibacterales bacterium]
MILIDANLLLYAFNADAPEHAIARPWLEERLSGLYRVGLPWPSLLAFIRLACNPAVVSAPLRAAAAWKYVEEWLALDNVWIPEAGPGHAAILAGFMDLSQMTSRLVPDAHLAALAIEHGLTLCSTDGDFAKFPGLKWLNPLAVEH